MQKTCSKCGNAKNITEFHRRNSSKDGYEGRCKECCKQESLKYTCTCVYCNTKFKSRRINAKYCKKECESLNRIKKVKTNCAMCGKELNYIPSRVRDKNFCDSICQYKFFSISRMGEKHHRYSRKKVNCYVCNEPLIRENNRVQDGKKYFCSNKCKSIGNSKENSPVWNDNLTMEERTRGRKFLEYEQWRKQVYERDKYTCQCCSDNKGHNLEAHHILNYSEYEELRLDVDNGITFCEECHKNFHTTYGYKNNNKTQLEIFLKK